MKTSRVLALLGGLAAVILLAGIGTWGRLAAAQTGTRYFPETGHTAAGRFLEYWEQHGGLAQQGYPLTEATQEVSDLNGKTYTVQYFERAVFEQHPEYGPPYDVLLTLLGVFAYEQRYGTAGAPGQQASTVNPRYFAETGHTLGGKFRAYWETHGGLAQQGYPISDEFQERSALDGKTYTVQYFQRAVFELHPENAGTPYEVLLSQLGTFRYRARYTQLAIPPPAPGRGQGAPVASDSYLVWPEANTLPAPTRNSHIRALDLQTNQPLTVTEGAGEQTNPVIAGSIVFWEEGQPDCLGCHVQIHGKDLATGADLDVLPATADRRMPAVGGGHLAWVEDQHSLVLRALPGEVTNELAALQPGQAFGRPVMSDEAIVWSEGDPNRPPQLGGPIGTLRAYDFKIGKMVTLGQQQPWPQPVAVSDHRVLWSTANQTLLTDLETGQSTLLPAGVQVGAFRGDTIVWASGSSDLDIWGLKLTDLQPALLVVAPGDQEHPAIAGNWLVWQTADGFQDALGRLASMPLVQAFANAPGNTLPTPVPTAPLPSLTPLPPTPLPVSPTAGPDIRLSAQGIAGEPIVAGHYAFYFKAILDRGNTETPEPQPTPVQLMSLYGGDSDQHTTFLIKNLPAGPPLAASDGRQVVWVELAPNGAQGVQSYDLTTHSEATILSPASTYRLAGLALDGGVLYYQDNASFHHGIYAHNLSTNLESVISTAGQKPVAAGGVLLWSEEQPGNPSGTTTSLHVIKTDGSRGNTVLATQAAALSNYAVAGDNVVWAYHAAVGDNKVHLYNLNSGTGQTLSTGLGLHPVIGGHVIAWSEPAPAGIQGWQMQIDHLDSGTVAPFQQPILQLTQVWGLIGEQALAFTVDYDNAPERDLYVIGLNSGPMP
ncbi:MAG TPA: hypothetical protein VKY74_17820 [Chloroflexia bacterium]|nr:hypothetical protein [Chloroflexia bacterium]